MEFSEPRNSRRAQCRPGLSRLISDTLRMTCQVMLVVLTTSLWGADQTFDVVIYGATASGAVAAIAAAGEGRSVALLDPGRHAGGMVTGGLGRTDMDRQEHVIGGLSREFFERVGKHYGQPLAWTFEPSIAEKTLNDWLKQAGVRTFFNHRLASITKPGASIVSIRMENGNQFAAKVFIDASYEGDLMKAAGVSYVVGREGIKQHGESLAGRRDILPGSHQLRFPTSPFDASGKLIRPIVPFEQSGHTGEGDNKIQAYCFRLCLTDNPENRLPLPRPTNYNPERFALVRNYVMAGGDNVTFRDFVGISPMPNRKTDINSSIVSTNLIGASWEYPDASYERRQQIWDEHLAWAQGLVYFLANEPVVPKRIRDEMNKWGLAKDEFIDTGHWPHQLYIRQARRMLGEYFMTQPDLETHRRKYDTIGMGGYNIDVREVQWIAFTVYRFPQLAKEVQQEGYISVPVEPYEIPYRSLLPKQQECDNLLVTSCISASHIAYASMRMEPQYMILGHSAGIAAALAVQSSVPVHKIDIVKLQRRLSDQKQILSLNGARTK
jgi:hypothetical protein